MLWGDNVGFMPRDVPIGALLLCLRVALDLPLPARVGSEIKDDPSPMLLLDLESWFAFSLLALPMFGGDPPAALQTALPQARRLLLALGMIHSGDSRTEVLAMLEASRTELRRIAKRAGLDLGPDAIFERQVTPPGQDSSDA